jgi:hypothetical protein
MVTVSMHKAQVEYGVPGPAGFMGEWHPVIQVYQSAVKNVFGDDGCLTPGTPPSLHLPELEARLCVPGLPAGVTHFLCRSRVVRIPYRTKRKPAKKPAALKYLAVNRK